MAKLHCSWMAVDKCLIMCCLDPLMDEIMFTFRDLGDLALIL